MKFPNLLLGASLALNVVLFAAIWRMHTALAPTEQVKPAGSRQARKGISPSAEPIQTQAASDTADTLWSQLDDADFGLLADHLRAAGFPPADARAVLQEILRQRREQEREAILGKPGDMPYWQARWMFPSDPAKVAKMRDMNLSYAVLENKYIDTPEALAFDEDARFAAQRRFGDLPLGTLQRLVGIENEFRARELQAYGARSVTPSEDEIRQSNEAYQAIQHDKTAAIAQVLGPDQFQQWQLRNSPLAGELRNKLESFRPTEAEYKAIFAAYNVVEQQYPTQAMTDEQLAARRAALDQARAQLEPVLGPDRYAEYVQAENSGNDKLTRLMARLDLPLTTIGTVNQVRDDVTQQAQTIRADTQLAPAERDARLAALATEAKKKLTTVLGDRGFSAYRDMKGDWLNALSPTPNQSH